MIHTTINTDLLLINAIADLPDREHSFINDYAIELGIKYGGEFTHYLKNDANGNIIAYGQSVEELEAYKNQLKAV